MSVPQDRGAGRPRRRFARHASAGLRARGRYSGPWHRAGNQGRDHNPFTFTSWLAGGGFKGGTSYGDSDEWSYRAVQDPIYCYDLHATVLRQLG